MPGLPPCVAERERTGRQIWCPPWPSNTTDLDSRNIKTLRGWVQGYNAQGATTERQIVIAAELTNSSADFGQIGPMVDAVRRELGTAGVTELPEVVLADAGYGTRSRCKRSPPTASRS